MFRVFHTRGMRIWTVGHGTRPIEDFIGVLVEAKVRTLGAIRSSDRPRCGRRSRTRASTTCTSSVSASPEFGRDLATLESLARDVPTAYMCAETLWWRCHRRMLSDLLTVRGWDVVHLLGPGKSESHRLWDVARVVDGAIVYDGGAIPLRPE